MRQFEILFLAVAIALGVQAAAQTSSTNTAELTQKPQLAPPYTWTFKDGRKLECWLVDFQGADQIRVRRAPDFQDSTVSIWELSDHDQAYLTNLHKKVLRNRLATELNDLKQRGYVELTVDMIENNPEQFRKGKYEWQKGKYGWMDAEFVKFEARHLLGLTKLQQIENERWLRLTGKLVPTTDWREKFLGFAVRDKSDGY